MIIIRKIIKLTILGIIILIVFWIYVCAKNNKIYYVVLGDTISTGMNPYGKKDYGYSDYLKDSLKIRYYKNYSKENNTTIDIIEDIKYKPKIKKDLRESNLVTLTIGLTDFNNSIENKTIDVNKILDLKDNINKIIPNIDKTLKELRKYAKEKIIIIGYYNPVPFLFNTSAKDLDILFAYIDEEYRKLSEKYDCIYISTYEVFKNNDYLPNPRSIYPNTNGYKEISKLIKKYLQTAKSNI